MGIFDIMLGKSGSKAMDRILADTPTNVGVLERSDPIKSDPVKEAVALIKSTSTQREDVATIDAEIHRQNVILARLFNIEKDAKDVVMKKIDNLIARRKFAVAMDKFGGKYLPISHDVLKWRDDRGYPKLGLFTLNNPVFRLQSKSSAEREALNHFRLTGRSFIDTQTGLPGALYSLYADVERVIETEMRRKGHNIGSLKAFFSGVIPESAREKIAAAKKDFGDNIFIIAEVNMSYEGESVPIGDPIAAGWCGTQLWHIDDFDTSAVEEAALLVGPNNP